MSVRKSLAFLAACWAVSLLLSLPPAALRSPPMRARPEFGGACLPAFSAGPAAFPAAYFALGFLVPVAMALAANLKVAGIAKYHEYR